MEARELLATRRMGTGKGTARKLRATGLVPGVCYGRGSEPIALSLDPVALKAALEGAQGLNTLLRLEIDDGGSKDQRLVMLKDRQYHPMTRKLVHADFVEIREGEKVRIEIPVRIVGTALGVKDGGMLSQPRRKIVVDCQPDKIPSEAEVDVTALDLGMAIHIADLVMPEGVTAVYDANFTVAVVVAPTQLKEEVAEVAEGAEGAEVAEGAEGAEGAEKKGEGEEKKAEGEDKKDKKDKK